MAKLPKISVIIPCFNEEMWVAKVILSLLNCASVFEIIAVDDGSTDDTLKILKLFQGKIKIISHQKNKGKGFAMATGIKKAKGEIVVFADAHHLNIKNSHLEALTNPLIKNQADVVLGTTVRLIPGPFWRFTGFRAYWKKDLLPHLKEMEKARLGVEIYLHEIFKKKRVKLIYPRGLVHLAKHQKMPISQVSSATLDQLVEMTRMLAQVKGIEPQKIKRIFTPKKINSIKSLKKAAQRLKNKEIMNFLKEEVLSYFEK